MNEATGKNAGRSFLFFAKGQDPVIEILRFLKRAVAEAVNDLFTF